MKYNTVIETLDEQREEFVIEILDEERLLVNGKLYQVDFESICEQPVYSLLIDGKSHEAYVYPAEQAWQVLLPGSSFTALVEDERQKTLRLAAGSQAVEGAEFHLKSPMPGLVVSVNVEDGQTVEKGDLLVILESMKMQNELKSPRLGVVTRLRVKAGDRVEQQETMLSVI
jgi:biotin carboxyl carrier protein